MDLPTTHKVPIKWLEANASPAIRYRVARDLGDGSESPPDLSELAKELAESRLVTGLTKRQKGDGSWAGKMLTPGGTVEMYRRLVELGVPVSDRSLQNTNRIFYRLLSRDPDPTLAFELKKHTRGDSVFENWARSTLREAATASLVEAKQNKDPRVRGAAQRIIDSIDEFLKSEYAEDPFTKTGSKTLLQPNTTPPTRYSVAMMAHMPTLQRERAEFVEQLGKYITTPIDKKVFWIQAGKQTFKEDDIILGDPLSIESSGRPKDLPFAIHWLELLARLQCLHMSETAVQSLAKLLSDCNDQGIWTPKSMRTAPSAISAGSNHMFPLELDTKTTERRRSDVTFRLALIAHLMGMELERT